MPDREPARILVTDDEETYRLIITEMLRTRGHRVTAVASGPLLLAELERAGADLILLDIEMPGQNGLQLCRELKSDPRWRLIPLILVTGHQESGYLVRGLDQGADDYIRKPFQLVELEARVRSLLRLGAFQRELDETNRRLADLNRTLDRKVTEKVEQLERANRLRRFFSPQIVETLLSAQAEDFLRGHRRRITVVFLDLRGFTAFTEGASPEEVLGLLREYHAAVGPIIFSHGGTLEHFAGDGIMIFLGDPEPMPDHAARALAMALELQRRLAELAADWSARGFQLGVGIGLATGDAMIGAVGYEGRFDYAALGPATNLAARLCAQAAAGQILLDETAYRESACPHPVRPLGPVAVRGFRQLQHVYELLPPPSLTS